MIESRNFQGVLFFFLIVIVLEGDSRRPRLKEEKQSERRDYRPSKWVANSAMDVWYGNKSMVDILSREFSDVMNRIALRPVRSPVPTEEINSDVSKLTESEEDKNELNQDAIKVTKKPQATNVKSKGFHAKHKPIKKELNNTNGKRNDQVLVEQVRKILLRNINDTISKVISDYYLKH